MSSDTTTQSKTHKARPSGTPAYAWGYNNSGALGVGHSARAFEPVPARLPAGTVDVQGGVEFSVARTSSGILYVAGGNTYGQLGDGTTRARLTWAPIQLPKHTVITDVQAGSDHVLALTERGQVYAWGRNHRGQIGVGSTELQLTPTMIIAGNVIALGAGNGVSAAITRKGDLLTWGRNGAGQLAQPKSGNVAIPTMALLPKGSRAVSVDAGYHHMVVLTKNAEVLSFGADPHGKPLGLTIAVRPSWGRVRQIRAGEDFTLALTERGTLLAWGANRDGQLGAGDHTNRATPTVVSIPASAGRITGIWAGDYSAVAITSNHHVYTWGATNFGQAGRLLPSAAQNRPAEITSLNGAHLTGVHGGAYHTIVTTTRGPVVRLKVTPARTIAAPYEHVNYHVNGVDAFGHDLGPTEGLGIGRISLRVSGGEAVGHTVQAKTPGLHHVIARSGRLAGTAALVIKNGK